MIRINKLKQDRCFWQKKHPLIFDGSRWIFTIGSMCGSFFVDYRATQVYKVDLEKILQKFLKVRKQGLGKIHLKTT